MVKNGLATVHQQTGQGNLIVLDFDAKVHQRIRQGTQLLGGRLRCHHTLEFQSVTDSRDFTLLDQALT